jgi:prephenate dehydratase
MVGLKNQTAHIIPQNTCFRNGAIPHDRLSSIHRIHTLGPSGTNCERAAHYWLSHRATSITSDVSLYPTLEEAAEHIISPEDALLGCVVYPKLNDIVFDNVNRLMIGDIFLLNTHSMVLAKRPDAEVIRSVATHPAPHPLIPKPTPTITYAKSNIEAAFICDSGETDACVTTLPAAYELGLEPVCDFGPIVMGFTIHILR